MRPVGGATTRGSLVEEMMRPVAGDVTGLATPGRPTALGPESNPAALTAAMTAIPQRAAGRSGCSGAAG